MFNFPDTAYCSRDFLLLLCFVLNLHKIFPLKWYVTCHRSEISRCNVPYERFARTPTVCTRLYLVVRRARPLTSTICNRPAGMPPGQMSTCANGLAGKFRWHFAGWLHKLFNINRINWPSEFPLIPDGNGSLNNRDRLRLSIDGWALEFWNLKILFYYLIRRV